MANNKGQALRPEVFNLPSFQKEEKTDEEILTDDEKILGTGANNSFWKILRRHIDNCITELDQVNEQAISSGASLEEIGRNTVVVNLTKGVLRRIFAKVEDSKEALEGANDK